MWPTKRRLGARGLLALLVVAVAAPALAQGGAASPCPDNGVAPTPPPVAVTAVPIVVPSTVADYFVLYVRHELDDGSSVDIPVLVKKGEAGTTTLAENVAALPAERYRVEQYRIDTPADIDCDGLNDLTELDNLGTMNPLQPGGAIDPRDGLVSLPDRAAFDAIDRDGYSEAVLVDVDTALPGVYFLNSNRYDRHGDFAKHVLGGVSGHNVYVYLDYHPNISGGTYVSPIQHDSVAKLAEVTRLKRLYTVLASRAPLLQDDLAVQLTNDWLVYGQDLLPALRESRIDLLFDEDVLPESTFIPMNEADGLGRLRLMTLEERPDPRDVVLYEALPNELPRVAGIITTVPQTPLAHVNLRAVQEGVPNAYIRDALSDPDISALIGRYVRYSVTEDAYTIRAATEEEVDAHYAASRPAHEQTPERDLTVRQITPLAALGFAHWSAFGVKAANVAELRKLGFPAGTVPDGYAIPFYFYDEFMKANGFYDDVAEMLADADFQTDYDEQEQRLKELRKKIEDADPPQWIIDALVEMNMGFPAGINRRYRSSTNNEDLPGFNGAGLYDSKSQKPSEDEEDLAKSLKEVYASLWNYRAFIERDFHRVDHLTAAMGVLVHPSYQDERVNGVAVSFDPLRGWDNYYYVNAQLGEDLVTNPEAHSRPEELLVSRAGLNKIDHEVVATSNLVAPGRLLMGADHLNQLYRHLGAIHLHFARRYAPGADEPFAMEIEFKITRDNVLAIKQARPWVSAGARDVQPPPPPGGGSGGSSGGSRRPVDEHGDSPAQATVLALRARAPWRTATAGQINPAGDRDYFQLTVPHAGVLVVETTGGTATVGTVWQDGAAVATAASGGVRQNFRLRVPVTAGRVVIAVTGKGRRPGAYTLETTLVVVGYLENPGHHSFQSGIGVISGWVCGADEVEMELNGVAQPAAYRTERVDTESVCGDSDNGFGLLFNWNLLDPGAHVVVALVDGVELGRATVTVTTLGAEFLRDETGSCELADFPTAGETVTLVWQQRSQNFVIAGERAPSGENRAGAADVGYLENPGPHSFQSGIGVISGWVCAADEVEIELNGNAQPAGYGTERLDTADSCGDTDNGFGLLVNWNLLGEGEHEVVAWVDGVELGRATVWVTTLGEEFLRDVEGACMVEDFPMLGETTTLAWQQSQQNFVITGVE